MVESYGTGIKRIKALYKNSQRQAVFESAPGAFKTTLFNLNIIEEPEIVTPYQPEAEKEIVMKLAASKGMVTRRDVEEALSVGASKAYSILTNMCNDGVLIMQKAGKRTQYVPVRQDGRNWSAWQRINVIVLLKYKCKQKSSWWETESFFSACAPGMDAL